jgi:hypothetical protein
MEEGGARRASRKSVAHTTYKGAVESESGFFALQNPPTTRARMRRW